MARDKKTGLADQSYLSHRNFIQTCLDKYDSLMVKKTKLSGLPKFESVRGSTSASLKIGEILVIRKKLASF